VALATLLGAGAACAAWRWLTVRGRAQGRRAWLRNALGSDDREQWTSALRSVRAWAPSEIRGVDDLLLGVAEDSAHPAAERRSVLRRRLPSRLLAPCERAVGGGRARSDQIYRGRRGGLLLQAAVAADGGRAAVEALARRLCGIQRARYCN
jgi:hypothetical protein